MDNSILERENKFLKLNEQLNAGTVMSSVLSEKGLKKENISLNKSTPLSRKQPLKVKHTITTNNSYVKEINGGKNIDDIKLSEDVTEAIRKYEFNIKENINDDKEGKPIVDKKSNTNQNINDKFDFMQLSPIHSTNNRIDLTNKGDNTDTTNTTAVVAINNEIENNFDTNRSSNTDSCALETPQQILGKFPKKGRSSEGLIRFLKAKITHLHQELGTCSDENRRKNEEVTTCLEQQKKLTLLRDQTVNKNSVLTVQVSKLEAKNADLEIKLKEKEKQITTLRKELETIKQELKNLSQTNATTECRVNKLQDDVDCAKKNYALAKETERQIRDISGQERKFYENQLKTLRKQRLDLMTAYKKQLILLDNLKRQNHCLEQAKLIQFTERDFAKILDWNNLPVNLK